MKRHGNVGNLNAASYMRRRMPVAELAALYARQGSIERLASRLGYSVRTIYRWLRASRPLRSAFDDVVDSRR